MSLHLNFRPVGPSQADLFLSCPCLVPEKLQLPRAECVRDHIRFLLEKIRKSHQFILFTLVGNTEGLMPISAKLNYYYKTVWMCACVDSLWRYRIVPNLPAIVMLYLSGMVY